MNMNTLAVFCIAALAVVGQSCRHDASHDGAHESAQESHSSHATHSMSAAPTPPVGQRWPTDEPLRTAMLRIRTAVENHVAAFEARQLSADSARALAATVEENVQYMIANCKLSPEPDAALHVLIGRMLTATTALKQDPMADVGVPDLLGVLHDYQTTFDHPDWSPIAARH